MFISIAPGLPNAKRFLRGSEMARQSQTVIREFEYCDARLASKLAFQAAMAHLVEASRVWFEE